MDQTPLEALNSRQLFGLYGRLLDELQRRRLVRTKNNPVADYGEWIAAKALDFELASKSTCGHDGVSECGKRYEVKCRRLTASNPSRQLSPFRQLEGRHFDMFVGILFDKDFCVHKGCLVPFNVILERAVHREHVNGHIFHLRDEIWKVKGVEDITFELQQAQDDSPDLILSIGTPDTRIK